LELLCFFKLLLNFTLFFVELQSFLAYCNNILSCFWFDFITHCLQFVLDKCLHFNSTTPYWYQQDLKTHKMSSTPSQQFYSFLLVFHFYQMLVPLPFQFNMFVSFVTSILWVDLTCIWKAKNINIKMYTSFLCCVHLLYLSKQLLCSNSCNM